MSTVRSAVDIIKETVQYYLEDFSRRGLNDNKFCMYITPTGQMCAVGRCMLPEILETLGNSVENENNVESLINNLGLRNHDEFLKEEYRGHPISFWNDLQSLHDTPAYWRHSIESKNLRKKKIQDLITKYSKI